MQNREAQRRFRIRKERYAKDLQSELVEMQARHNELCNSFNQQLEIKEKLSFCITALNQEINMLRREWSLPAEIWWIPESLPDFNAPNAEQGLGQFQGQSCRTDSQTLQLLETHDAS